MNVNGPERSKLGQKKFLVVDKACMAMFWPTPSFNSLIFHSIHSHYSQASFPAGLGKMQFLNMFTKIVILLYFIFIYSCI